MVTIDDQLERDFYEKECIEENVEGDNPPIGIVMSHYKDELMVEYATYGMDSNLFVSKYELFLPNKEDLRKLVRNILVEK